MNVYPYNDVGPDTVLLYRPTPADRYVCQVVGCRKTFKDRASAWRHGKTHFAALGLDPQVARSCTHTGPRPVSEEGRADYRRQYRRDWMRQKSRAKKEEQQHARREALLKHLEETRSGAGSGRKRRFPLALAELQQGAAVGSKQGYEFQAVCSVADRGSGQLVVTGNVRDEAMVASIRCALAWFRLHWEAVARLVLGGDGEEAGGLVEVDMGRQDLDYYVEMNDLSVLSTRAKCGTSAGLAVACSLVRLITGLGVEMCVAMTGEVSLTGAISAVSGLEGKLRFAHESERIEVVVLPRDNLREAEALVEQHGLTSIRLMPVASMEEVIRRLFLQSVDDMQDVSAAAEGRGLTPCRRIAEARSWAILVNGEREYPTIECALLPGSGQRWFTGMQESGVAGPSLTTEQAIKSVRCAQEMLASPGMGLPPRKLAVVDMLDKKKWDLYIHLRGTRARSGTMGLAAVAALLSLALGRPIDRETVFYGEVTLRGLVASPNVGLDQDVISLVDNQCSRLLVDEIMAESMRQRVKVMLEAREEGSGEEEAGDLVRRLQALKALEVENVLTLGRAFCGLIWPDLQDRADSR